MYEITVEPDDCHPGKFMIKIVDSAGYLVGIPLRNVTRKEALRQLNPFKFAFEFGIKYAKRQIREDLDKL